MRTLNYKVTIAVCIALLSACAQAEQWEFDAAAFGGGISDKDIALFNQGGQLPGTYRVAILLNGHQVDLRDVTFLQQKDAEGRPLLFPCLSRTQLSRYGIKTEDYPGLAIDSEGCAVLSAIPDARADFSFSGQQLLLSIPQAALRRESTDIASQEMWDDGVPALLMNYQTSISHIETRGEPGSTDGSEYLQLEPGANLGAWRLRNSTTWEHDRGQLGRWQSAYTYVERGLYGMKSRLTLGERFTPSDVFDSVPFLGVMLGSDKNMVPSSMRSFSPVVRGIARTQARVEVRQSGYMVYSATVAPGPFVLDSLSLSGSGGDLQVTVHEADGNDQVFVVPYQTPAVALHEGYLDYSLMAGKYRPSDASVTDANVAQVAIMYGLPLNLTVYGGWQGATHYQALSAGLGMSLGQWGSLSLDATGARGHQSEHKSENGGTWRLRYSKLIDATDTMLALSSYQYASSGYQTLSDVLESYRQDGNFSVYANKRKSRTTLSMSQSLQDAGSVSLSGSRDTYRCGQKDRTSFSVSYSVGICGVSLSLSWAQNRRGSSNDQLLSTMISIPLSRWLGGNTHTTWQITSPTSGRSTQQMGISGEAYDRQLNWNVMQRHQFGAGDRNSALQLGWNGAWGQLDGSYSYSSSSRQMGLDASGGLLITRDGLTVGQPLDGTVALAEAPGASGVPVGGMAGVKTDFRGYALVGGLLPYQENVVSMDPTRLTGDAEVTQTDVIVVPTEGAVIPATFATHIGARALVTLTRPGGRAVPFGALVTPQGQASADTGINGENGQVYLSGLADKGLLLVRWGPSAQQMCRADYRLPDKPELSGLYMTSATCH